MNTTFHGMDIASAMRKRGSTGISIAVSAEGRTESFTLGSGRPGCSYEITPTTLFQAGSVSKPTFAVTLMRFADRGIISLDEDISRYCGGFADTPVSFSALLSHTAGYNVHGFRGYAVPASVLSLVQVLAGEGNSKRVKQVYPYGKKYSYSGGGIELAELAFREITGLSLAEAARKEVFEVLGMEDSTFIQPLEEALSDRAAHATKHGVFRKTDSPFHYYPETGAAGLWTTPSDLVKLGLAVSESCRENAFLRQETALRMIAPVMNSYGLCMERFGNTVYGHDGVNYGFQCYWRFSAKKSCCVTVCENTNGGCLKKVGDALVRDLAF